MGLLPFLIQAAIHSWNTLGRKRALVVAGAALLFLIPALLPYVKAYVLTGNPVFPFGNSVFTSPLIQDSLVDYRFHQPLSWRTLFDLTFYTSRYYEGQDGSFAFQYLFLWPLSLVTIWKMRSFEQRSVVIAGFIAALAIASTQPNARYFYPALPLLMVGGAAVLGTFAGFDRRLFGACVAVLLVIGGLNVWFLPTSNWYHREFYLRPLFSERGRLEYLRSSNPVREVVPYVNSTTGGVLFVQNSDIAGVRQPVFSNNWHNLPFRKLIETARNAEHFYRIASDAGIEHYVKQRNPTKEDIELSPALFEFLDLCGEPEFETQWYVVLRTASNCAARLDAASPRYTTRVFPPGKYNDSDTRFTYLGHWDPGRGLRPCVRRYCQLHRR